MGDDEAERMLRQSPLLSGYLIKIERDRSSWRQYEANLDSALARLNEDDPYSLRRMAPPPVASPLGPASKTDVEEWCQSHPSHPWARTLANNDRLSQWISAVKDGGPSNANRRTDVDPFRESRKAAEEVHAWAFLVPGSFDAQRVFALSSPLLHWDSGVTFEIVRAAYLLDARQLMTDVQDLARCHRAHQRFKNSWTLDVARIVLREWQSTYGRRVYHG